MRKVKKLDRLKLPFAEKYNVSVEIGVVIISVSILVFQLVVPRPFGEPLSRESVTLIMTAMMMILLFSLRIFSHGFRDRIRLDTEGIEYFYERFYFLDRPSPKISQVRWKDISAMESWVYSRPSKHGRDSDNTLFLQIDVKNIQDYLTTPRLLQFYSKELKRLGKWRIKEESGGFTSGTLINIEIPYTGEQKRQFQLFMEENWMKYGDAELTKKRTD